MEHLNNYGGENNYMYNLDLKKLKYKWRKN